ncbi:hypothetical protein QM565_24205 [Geitlerinema splendidum]|nr:hypothetical protein [Geitlerinema splendidum]
MNSYKRLGRCKEYVGIGHDRPATCVKIVELAGVIQQWRVAGDIARYNRAAILPEADFFEPGY